MESNKSPLTGAILVHKDLVPNYMLLTSLQEAAKTNSTPLTSDSHQEQPKMAEVIITPDDDDEEITAEVSLLES